MRGRVQDDGSTARPLVGIRSLEPSRDEGVDITAGHDARREGAPCGTRGWTRSAANSRQSSRSRSHPSRYHRPCDVTRWCGSTRRGWASPSPLGRYSNCSLTRSRTACARVSRTSARGPHHVARHLPAREDEQVRSYKNLSDHDFELLVADVLGEEDGKAYEVFARGADRGVDLRAIGANGTLDIVQCKHMEGSSVSQVLSAARGEARKLADLTPEPGRYRFVTSRSLTASNKTEIRKHLNPWISTDNDVIGAEDLDLMLNRHRSVERRHVKLWLTSFAQLDRAIHAATWSRSEQLLADINDALPSFVDTGVFSTASERLHDEKVLVLSGPPGIGKTSVARMLVADAVARGFEPIEVSEDIDEANAVFDESAKQVFLYDDFLGATFLEDRLTKNEDKRLTSFMRRCRRSKSKMFILTTREHILRQAASWYEEIERSEVPVRRLLIEMKAYSRREKALILYNHVFHSASLTRQQKRFLARRDRYLNIIDHPNYNPRTIEYAIKNFSSDLMRQNLLAFTLGNLDSPEEIWRHAFVRQLEETERETLLFLSTLPGPVSLSELEIGVSALHKQRGNIGGTQTRQALKTLDDSFTRFVRRPAHPLQVIVTNPSVLDFAATWLRANPNEAEQVLRAAVFFEQLSWLNGQVVSRVTEAKKPLERALADAFRRTFAAQPMGGGDAGGAPVVHRTSANRESRLLFAAQTIADRVRGTGELGIWWRDEFDLVAQRWAQGVSADLASAVGLAALRANWNQLNPSHRNSITTAALAASTVDEWTVIVDTLDESPHIFDVDPSDFGEAFETWAEDTLSYSLEEVADLDDFYAIRDLADHLGVRTDNQTWIDAEEAIQSRPEQQWDESEYAPRVPLAEATDDELRAIFARLGD